MSVELPDSYESIYQRAMLQMESGNTAEAIESLLRIINRLSRLRPETLQRKTNLQTTLNAATEAAIEFLRWEQDYDQAISIAAKVADRLPDPDATRRRIASLTIEKGEVEEGLAHLNEMAEAKQDFDSWADLGAEYRVLDQYDQAVACYRSALRYAESNDEAAMANLALLSVYQDAGQVEDALDTWDMAVVLDPELAAGVIQVYGWLIRRGNLNLARKYLERERHPARRTFYEGLLDWQSGAPDDANRAWRRVLELDIEAEDPALAAWLEAALRLGEPARADERAQTIGSETQRILAAVVTLHGIAKLMLGEVDEAQEMFGRVADRMRRAWPSQSTIPAHRWELLTLVVPDTERQQAVEVYFEKDKSSG